MYRLRKIQEDLKNLVGWEQSFDPRLKLDPELTNSESGLVYQAAHPLLTLDNVANTMPVDFILQYDPWVANEPYLEGSKVRYDNQVWEATKDNTEEQPGVSDSWRLYIFLSDYLTSAVNKSIANVVQTFTRVKKLEYETRTLLDKKLFFDGAGKLNNTTPNKNRIVGFEITPIRSMGVTTKIDKVGIQLSAPANVDVYLFHSSQAEPVSTVKLQYTKEHGSFQWFNLTDFYMPYVSDSTSPGGSWYLVYSQSDLGPLSEAINVSKDWSREPCGTCNIGSVQTWREMSKFLQISPFWVNSPAGFDENPLLWGIEDMVYTNTSNYGLNCQISVECDITDFITSQRSMFQDVLQKQVAYDLLRVMAMNPDVRVNRNQFNVSQMDILYELDGNTNSSRPSGLGYELKKSYEALSIETKGIDRVCLACHNKGIRYKST